MFKPFRHEVDASEEDLIKVDVVVFVIAVGDVAQSFDATEVTFDRVAGAVGDTVDHPSLALVRRPTRASPL